MTKFLKLTPEACQRMWLRTKLAMAEKHGRTFPYQVSADMMRRIRELNKQAACGGED